MRRPRRAVLLLVGLAVLLTFVASLLAAIHARGLGVADDAFISYRVARNLAEGYGLAFNPEGPRVEAASNFLLTVLLAGAHGVGLSLIRSSLVIALICTAATLLLLTWCVRRTAGPWGLWAPFALASMTVVCRNVTNGLETSLHGLLLLVAVALYLRGAESPLPGRPGRRALFLSSLVFALVALTRPEGPIFVLALSALRGWELWRRRPRAAPQAAGAKEAAVPLSLRLRALLRTGQARTELAWLAGFGVVFIPYTIWRVSYFGALFPNTFHAKELQFGDTLSKLSSGASYLEVMALFEPLLPLSLAAGLLSQLVAPSVRGRVLLTLVLTQCAFMVLSGGDWPHMFEFGRFLYPALPLSLWLLADSGLILIRLGRPVVLGLAALATLALCQVNLVELINPEFPGHYHVRVRVPLAREALATAYLEQLPRLPRATWLARSTQTWDMRRYHNNFDAAVGLWLRDRFGTQTRVASIQAGQFAYWCEMPFFDMFGLVTPAVTRHRAVEPAALTRLIIDFDPDLIAFYKSSGSVHHRHLALDGALWEAGYGLRYVIQRGRFRSFVVFQKGFRGVEDPRQVLFAAMEDLPRRVGRDRWIDAVDPGADSL